MKIEEFESWSTYYQVQLDGVSYEPNPRRRVAMGLLHLSLEHHQSILTLAKYNLLGSSFALLRCQFEAMLRGLWFLRCATDADIGKFIDGENLELKVNTLISEVETKKGYQNGELKRYKEGKWKAMNDYTHGGFFQIATRTQGNEVTGRNFSEHSIWFLAESSKLSLLSILDLCIIIEQPELSLTFFENYFNIIEKQP
ncbi:hypothetical protein L5M28_15640 [Shewanella sp. SW32]|uniref:DUF6988 family protein n=1 Tax=unclassified Shewanella TaxID=196818 RepID=UPI0021D98E01|nr:MULTISPECIES: hypothetical protein [unclassified Shewanella]MCU7963991.1 hypothetical protein [Shewanella sp. SW32]MCU7971808.1 hypothetical protein [Shewanella sp. SW29]